jgi:hypothetical protein
MKKVKYIGPMKRVKYIGIGQFFKGQVYELEDQKAFLILREPGFQEVKEASREPAKKGGKDE